MGTHTSNAQTAGMGMLQETGGRKTRQSMNASESGGQAGDRSAQDDCFREWRAGSIVNRSKRRELG